MGCVGTFSFDFDEEGIGGCHYRTYRKRGDAGRKSGENVQSDEAIAFFYGREIL